MRNLIFALLISMALPASAAEKLLLTGSSTVAPLMMEIAKKYEKDHPNARVDVQSGGSSKGIADAREGVADLGMVSRSLKPEESDLMSHRIAIDGISLISHKTNPIQNLNKDQVIKIYKGEIKNWKDVGGKDGQIVVINKAEGRSTLELFLQHFGLKASDVKAQSIIGENEQGIKMVSGNPNAVAYVSIGSAEAAIANNVSIKLLDLDGQKPSTEAVKTGKFPIIRDLILVTKKNPSPAALDLIKYAQSAKAADIVKEQYFVLPPKN